MKKLLVVSMLLIVSCSFYAFKTIEDSAEDVLKTLGIPERIARDCIWSSFSGMYLSHPGVTKLREIPTGERGSFTRQIAEYAKAYAATEDFKKKYLEYRDGRKPTPPEKPKSAAQMKQEQKDQMKKSIKDTEESMKKMSADQQKTMKGIVTVFKEQLKSLDDPNNPMFSPDMEKMMMQGYDMQMVEYNKRLAEWEKENPLTPNAMVKKWLTEFMNVSKDVDFNASLVAGDGGKKRFAKPEYERKSDHWKMCYRAGKETVEAGRAFAKQWLTELGN